MIINLFLLNEDHIYGQYLAKIEKRFRYLDLDTLPQHLDISTAICLLSESMFSEAIINKIRNFNIAIPIIIISKNKKPLDKIPINAYLSIDEINYTTCLNLLNTLPDHILQHAFIQDSKNQSKLLSKDTYSSASSKEKPIDSE